MKRVMTILLFVSLPAVGATFFYLGNKNPNSTTAKTTITKTQPTQSEIKQVVNAVTTSKINVTTTTTGNYFQDAADEISEMLNGEKPLSFKRAVFLTENAYYDGQLDWDNFCNQIDQIKILVKQMIVKKNLQLFKTAGNWAVFTFMTDSIEENNFAPYQYDFENFMGDKDYQSFMVSNLLKTKKGNCHSLPYLYKILADEVNVEAFIATAPMHCFIKHKDEQGQWWNLELTSGTFSRTSFIMESFNVSDAGMESGLYMKPLSEKESVALCLSDLLDYYDKKTGVYYDQLVIDAYTTGLKYYQNSLLQLAKADAEKYLLDEAMEKKGISDYKKVKKYPDLQKMFNDWTATTDYIKKIGYSTLTPTQYKDKVNAIKDGQQAQAKN